MATNIVKGNIGNALHSVAPDHIVATADEIFDEVLGQYQDQINKQKSTIGNNNCTSVEAKVNALIDCISDLVTKVVFYNGIPYQIPTQLKSRLTLTRYNAGSGSTTPAMCGSAMCGSAMCGII